MFLNPLNDVTTVTVAATDVLHLPSHVYKIGDAPRFPAYYNHLKQEYISARYGVYQYQRMDPLKGHFTDREVLILDNTDGGEFGHHVAQLKTAFRSAYALFDKIALFLNDYFSIGMNTRDVSFQRIWVERGGNAPKPKLRTIFDGNQNWPLRGLYPPVAKHFYPITRSPRRSRCIQAASACGLSSPPVRLNHPSNRS